MAGYNGTGQFSFTYSWANDAANGVPITASRMDQEFADATSGFNLAMTRDGQGAASAIIPFAAGITLSGGNTLATYQTATWTPVDASGASLIFTAASGTYVKIGLLVFISGALTYPTTSNTGGAAIGGLPFVSAAIARQVIPLALTTSGTVPVMKITSGVQFISARDILDNAILNSSMSATQFAFSGVYQAAT